MIIRPIKNDQELEAVYRLAYDAYRAQGYAKPQGNRRLLNYAHLDGIYETTVLVALQEDQIVGTCSFTVDGPKGLNTDQDFLTECNQIRMEGRHLGASWRMATKGHFRSSPRLVLALIRSSIALYYQYNVTSCVFTLNPRHERIYQKLLNLETIAKRSNSLSGLDNAPATLMRWDIERSPRRWLPPNHIASMQQKKDTNRISTALAIS